MDMDFDGDGEIDADEEWAAADSIASEDDERIRRLVQEGYLHPDAAEYFMAERRANRTSPPLAKDSRAIKARRQRR